MKHSIWTTAADITVGMAVVMAAAPMASAEPVGDSLIAQDPGPAPLAPNTQVVGVDADIPSGLTVRGTAGKPVTLRAAGEKPRTAVAATPDAPIVFTKLTPGTAYKVFIGGKRIPVREQLRPRFLLASLSHCRLRGALSSVPRPTS